MLKRPYKAKLKKFGFKCDNKYFYIIIFLMFSNSFTTLIFSGHFLALL